MYICNTVGVCECMYESMYIRIYVCMYVCMYVGIYVCMSNLVLTDSDTITNVHDTYICCWVLLLQSGIGQSQHCTSEYFHFCPNIYLCVAVVQ